MRRLYLREASVARNVMAVAITTALTAGVAHAYKFETSPEWDVNLDNTVVYAAGWRMQERDPAIANHFAYQSGDAKFAKGDMVTNRISDLIEFQGVYQQRMGFRVSGSVWKDYAYNDHAKAAPGQVSPYLNDTYSDYTKRYFLQGGEWLDAFLFLNTEVANTRVYLKAGRLSQYWGNAFFFGFSNIAYSQQPIDYIKGFSQPGSEVKELFLPRKQILVSADLTPELSVSAQYFFEYRPNRYPEAGTYLGFFDPLFNGPTNLTPTFGVLGTKGIVEPPNNNQNWGFKVAWSPAWAAGDIGIYYRQFDEVDPWLAQITTSGYLQNPVNQKAKLFGISYEHTFGTISTGFELSHRMHTALNSTPFNPLQVGGEAAKGDITNFIANTFIQLGTTPLWDSGILLAEISYTHLNKVESGEDMYFGEGHVACQSTAPRYSSTGKPNTWRDGCSTKNSLAFAMLFDPQWLQVFPGIDIDMPISYTVGVKGNPAYRASGFYGEQTNIYSIGIKATYQQKTSLSLSYNGYNWRTNTQAGGIYFGNNAFGGIGAISLNDRGWLQLQLKTSF